MTAAGEKGWGAEWRRAGDLLDTRVEVDDPSTSGTVARELASGIISLAVDDAIFLRTGPSVRVSVVDRRSGDPVGSWEFERDAAAAEEFLSLIQRDLKALSATGFAAEYSLDWGPE
jgi:hypothetical protein